MFRKCSVQFDATLFILEKDGPAARPHLLKKGIVFSSWRSHNIRDFLTVTRCYNCQRFGHIAKHCRSEQQCGYCSSTENESRDCRHKLGESKHQCANCIRSGNKDANHHTASNQCPIFQHRAQETINATFYDVNGS
ncbi:hypothetical protein MTP99_013044 [Tenebrio molitor]|nr:hypothetical protein MTP99_013044 [Tenebrio molitor]